MEDRLDAEAFGDLDGFVAAGIVHEQDFIHHVQGQVPVSHLDRLGGAVGGKNDDYLLVVQHVVLKFYLRIDGGSRTVRQRRARGRGQRLFASSEEPPPQAPADRSAGTLPPPEYIGSGKGSGFTKVLAASGARGGQRAERVSDFPSKDKSRILAHFRGGLADEENLRRDGSVPRSCCSPSRRPHGWHRWANV